MVAKHRFAAAFLAALIIVAASTSLFIVQHEADHNCVGEGCPYCAVISICQNTLKTLSEAVAVSAVTVMSVFAAVVLFTAVTAELRKETPISLKVKLLN